MVTVSCKSKGFIGRFSRLRSGWQHMSSRYRSLSNDLGQASVEFALTFVVFVFLVMGVVDFARAFYDQLNLSHLAREGARKATVCQNSITVQNTVNNAAVLTQVSTVTISYQDPNTGAALGSAAVGSQVVVQLQSTFSPITPLVGPIIGTLTLQSRGAMLIDAINASC